MPKNRYNNLLFDHIDGFELFLIFLVQNLSYPPLLQILNHVKFNFFTLNNVVLPDIPKDRNTPSKKVKVHVIAN